MDCRQVPRYEQCSPESNVDPSASVTVIPVMRHALGVESTKCVIDERIVQLTKLPAAHVALGHWWISHLCCPTYPSYRGLFQWSRIEEGRPLPGALPFLLFRSCRQSIQGSIISAKAVRARLSRDFTVPRLQSVISAISSYDLPSSSRSTKT